MIMYVDRVDGKVRVAITAGRVLEDDDLNGQLLMVAYIEPSDAVGAADKMRAAAEEILGERAMAAPRG